MLNLDKKRNARVPVKSQAFARLREMGVPVETVLDVGVLTCTWPLIQQYRDKLHVLMEPIEEFAPRIREIYEEQSVNYELVTAAMSDKDGEVTMQTKSVREGATITHARIVDDEHKRPDLRKVKSMTLAKLIEEHQYKGPFLLKLDVDGAELEILKGAAPVLDQCSVICVEVGIKNFVQRADYIIRSGFQPFDIVDLCYYDRRLVQADMLFVNDRIIKEMDLEIYRDGFDIAKWEAFDPK
ncbi:MAG: FkbM family methyltransferase [Pseudomonadota bacterium]